LLAMQLGAAVAGTMSDFLFAAMLPGIAGLVGELTARAPVNRWYRGGVAMVLAAGVLTVWVNGAVGMIGTEGDPYNLLFLGVDGVALAGSIVARPRPSGMALAMAGAAASQVIVGAWGIAVDPRGAILSMLLGALWLAAATLFRQAAMQGQH